MTYLFKHRSILILSLFAALLYGYFYVNRAHVEIRVESPKQTYFKVYWASAGEQSYSEKKMARVRIRPGTEQYSFFIGDLRKNVSLRIDPSAHPGKTTVKEIIIRQPGLPTIHLSEENDFSRLRPFGDVESTEFSNKGWVVTSTGNHPRFQLLLTKTARDLNWPAEISRFLLLLVAVLAFVRAMQPLWHDYAYTMYFGIFILGLILTMAVISKHYQHPDESVHISAAEYYETHWLPPPVASQEIRHTYSPYGFSRLNTLEAYYFFAGKFARTLELFRLNQVLTLRLFNVVLFSILVLTVFRCSSFRLLFVPLLVSPQIWYIFSYVNSDAFALFITVLAGWQMVTNESSLNRFLEQNKIPLYKIMGLGLLFTLLFLTKKPFYFFIVFLLIYFIWRCIFQPFTNTKGTLKRLLTIACIGSVLVGARLAVDISVNGFNKDEKMRAMQELTANHLFKPSTELSKKHAYQKMRERGVNLKRFITHHRWGEKTFRSGFGTYGHMTVGGPDVYYNTIRVVSLGFLAFISFSIVIRGGLAGNCLLGGATLCSTALIFVALYHAWTVDFQAQGRYLFAIVPITGMVLAKTEKIYNQALFRTLFLSMFLLSVYSFVGIALLGLSKYGLG